MGVMCSGDRGGGGEEVGSRVLEQLETMEGVGGDASGEGVKGGR